MHDHVNSTRNSHTLHEHIINKMDMHTGSTDEYETDEHHFDGDGDSSEDELVAKKHVASAAAVGTKKRRVVVKHKQKDIDKNNDSDEDDSELEDDDEGAALKNKRSKAAAAAAAQKCDSSSDDDDSDKSTNNNKRSRRALGRINDNKTNTKKNTSSSRNNSDDSSASDNNDSDDSDDLGLGLGSNKQSRAASDRKRAALMQMYPSSSDDSDEDSSDDISFSAKKRKQSKPAAKAPPPSRKKEAIALDDSSDSEDSDSECVVDVTTATSTRSRTKPAPAKASAVAIDCMSSDSDEDSEIEIPPKRGSTRSTRATNPPSARKTAYKTEEGAIHHDPSVRANSNATLEAAKRARAALSNAQGYHAEDVKLQSLPSQVVPRASPAVLDLSSNDYNESTSMSNSNSRAVNNAPAVSYTGPSITIYLRYRDAFNKESKVSLKIKMDQPLQLLVDQFQHGTITQIKFDGQNLNLTKTPSFYDMDDEDLVDVVVVANKNGASTAAAATAAAPVREEKVVIHVRGAAGIRGETYEMKKSDPLKKVVDDYRSKNQLSTVTLEYNGRKLDTSLSCSQLNIANNAYLDAIVAGGPSIALIFRVNGKSNETERISIRTKEPFQPAMETFAQRRHVSVSQCQFVFDGETLRPCTTPEQLDLEGDEIIDVKVKESARPAASLLFASRLSATIQSAATAVASAVSSPLASTASSAPAMITIETNRNQNNNSRQKKWKMLDTSHVTKLKTDYTKYYKQREQVNFYFRNQLITNESKSLRDLGIRNGDMVYAMENGKAYKSMCGFQVFYIL